MTDIKEQARAILAKEKHKKPRPGSNDNRIDFPDENHPDQRGWKPGDPGKKDPDGI